MSDYDELHDVGKLKVDTETYLALRAVCQATGKSQVAVAREWCQKAARNLVHEANVIVNMTRGKGGREE